MSTDSGLTTFQYNNVTGLSMIGQGSFGKIYRGKYDSNEVVLKVLEDVEDNDIRQEAQFLNKL